jgi:hypothetical protein
VKPDQSYPGGGWVGRLAETQTGRSCNGQEELSCWSKMQKLSFPNTANQSQRFDNEGSCRT